MNQEKKFIVINNVVYYYLDNFYTVKSITIGRKSYPSYKRYFYTRVVHRNTRISIGKIICFPSIKRKLNVEGLIETNPSLLRVRQYLDYLSNQDIGLKHEDGSEINNNNNYWNLICHHRENRQFRSRFGETAIQVIGFNHQEYVQFRQSLNKFPVL